MPALLAATATFAQIRVCSYNVSNYAGGRVADLQTVVYGVYNGRSLGPDVILGQEFTSAAAMNAFKSLLNSAPGSPGDWASAPFHDGTDTDSVLFYRTSKVDYLGTVIVAEGSNDPNDQPRDTMRFDIRLKGYSSVGATLANYVTHMKAGSTDQDQARRLVEAKRIRADSNQLGVPFLIGGDFNIQTSSQAAYQELVGSQVDNDGRFFDPIKTPGSWNNNAAYRFVHTQDPAGSGGMDDRLDQILLASELVDGQGFEYLGNPNVAYSTSTWNDPNHSYRSWGNDGTSFNSSLTTTNNTMVGQAIAQAIINAANGSGHLPVFLDLRVPPKVSSPTIVDFGVVTQFSSQSRALQVWNSGDVSLWTQNGISNLNYSLSATTGFGVPSGSFSDAAGGGSNSHSITMDTSTLGFKQGVVAIGSNAPDEPIRAVIVRGIVRPSPWPFGPGIRK